MQERVQIGVFAAAGGWMVTSPRRQARFDSSDEAIAAARRQALVELWRGRAPELVVQDALGRRVDTCIN